MDQHFLSFFPLFFVALWIGVTTLLAVFSGWFRLVSRFPDREEEPLLKLRGLSGLMGIGVSMSGILRLSACPSGLRVGILRMFGLFSRDFFVPWGEITVVRKKTFFRRMAKLEFGSPRVGTLSIPVHIANRLASAVPGRWPEAGTFEEERKAAGAKRVMIEWALMTCGAALFFTIVPMFAAPPDARPPIAIGILFPAIFFGLVAIGRYLLRK